MERKRSFDINKLTTEEAEKLSVKIGEKVREICDDAVKKANDLLNIYGMEAKMQIVVQEIGKEEKPKKKRGRPKKAANL